MIWRCRLVPQYEKYKTEIDKAIFKVLQSGSYILSEEVNHFEKEFASYCGVKFAVGVASGTEALFLSLKALDIREGDEVITSPFTPIPTVSSIVMAGATPVFVDINRSNFLINVKKIKEVISSKTKAIMPVHLFGNMVEMDKLTRMAKEYSIPIIEDACQAHGSMYKNKKAGAWGSLGCFSFYPTKNLGAYGDGGLIVTNNYNLYKKLKLLRDYGRDSLFTTSIPGFNSRLDEIQAAILRVKLKYLYQLNARRASLANIYFDSLEEPSVEIPFSGEGVKHNYHVFTIFCNKKRNGLKYYLEKNKIQTNIYYPTPMHLQKGYRYLGYKRGDFPVSEKICHKVLALPMYPELDATTVRTIAKKINYFFKV